MVREGVQVAIVGRPNVGKSTLFNALLGTGRAIVTDIPGTTRDLLTETVDIDGMAVTLVDTAGIRAATADVVEAEGISRARLAASRAHLALVVLDRSVPLTEEDHAILAATTGTPRVIVANKSDLGSAESPGTETVVAVSAATGEGLDRLRAAIGATLGVSELHRDTPAITNVRHVALLERARDALVGARHAAAEGTPEEFVAADIADARAALEEITGKRTPDDTLNAIFARFCIGK